MTCATLWEKKGRVNKVVPVKSLALLSLSMRTCWGCLPSGEKLLKKWHSRVKLLPAWETTSLVRDYFSRLAPEKGKQRECAGEWRPRETNTCAPGLSSQRKGRVIVLRKRKGTSGADSASGMAPSETTDSEHSNGRNHFAMRKPRLCLFLHLNNATQGSTVQGA